MPPEVDGFTNVPRVIAVSWDCMSFKTKTLCSDVFLARRTVAVHRAHTSAARPVNEHMRTGPSQ